MADHLGFWTDGLDTAVLNEARSAIDQAYGANRKPAGYFFNRVIEAAYGRDHVLGRYDRDASELRDVKADELKERSAAWFTPRNGVLVVAGDIEPARVEATVVKYFGAIAAGPEPPKLPASPPLALNGERRIEIESSARDELLLVAWPSPAYGEELDRTLDTAALLVQRRLQLDLVDTAHTAVSVFAYERSRLGGSLFCVQVALHSAADEAKALKAIDEDIQTLLASPPSREEVHVASETRAVNVASGLDHVSVRAGRITELTLTLGGPSALDAMLDSARGATPASLSDALRSVVATKNRIVAVMRHNAGAPATGRIVSGGAQ